MRRGSPRASATLIFAAGVSASIGMFAGVTVLPLLAKDITGSAGLAGMPGAAGTAGTAIGAFALSAYMARAGRAKGLRAGYVLVIAGLAVGLVSAEVGSFVGLLAGALLIGLGSAAHQLGRFAAAELFPPDQRAQVVGWIVWAAAIGAIVGPNLAGPSEAIATALGLPAQASGLLVGVAFALLALAVTLALPARPPHREDDSGDQVAGVTRSYVRGSVARALLAVVGAQTGMVMVMSITPVHVRDHGHELGMVGVIMSAHFVGMYAFSPIAGWLVTRIGAERAAPIGLLVLAASAVASGTFDATIASGIGLGLFGLGLGWSIAFVAASAILARDVPAVARVRVEGFVDALAWTTSAVASVGGGLLVESWGYATMAWIAAGFVFAACAGLAVGGARRDPAERAEPGAVGNA